jgi:hypothetical protein
MCRNIRVLFNFEPPATEDEIHDAALQYVRKISGTRKPSKANQARFDRAVARISKATADLVESLETDAPPRTREEEARRAKARALKRFGPNPA